MKIRKVIIGALCIALAMSTILSPQGNVAKAAATTLFYDGSGSPETATPPMTGFNDPTTEVSYSNGLWHEVIPHQPSTEGQAGASWILPSSFTSLEFQVSFPRHEYTGTDYCYIPMYVSTSRTGIGIIFEAAKSTDVVDPNNNWEGNSVEGGDGEYWAGPFADHWTGKLVKNTTLGGYDVYYNGNLIIQGCKGSVDELTFSVLPYGDGPTYVDLDYLNVWIDSPVTHTLTPHRVTPGGTVVNMDTPVPINPGDTVRVQYKPSPGYVISEPIGVVGSVSGVDQTHYSHYNWATGFWYIDVVIPAGNTQNYDVNVQFDGNGTTTPPAGYFHVTASSTGNGTVTPADEYVKAGSTVYLNVIPNGMDTLQSFTDNGIGQANIGSLYTISNIQADHVIVASFSGTNLVTLSVPITGNGVVTVTPAGTILGLNMYAFTSGTSVTMTPVPDLGSTFIQWNIDASGSANPLSVTLNTSKTVGAEFNDGSTSYTLTPHRVTAGGTVVNMDIPVPINPGDTVRVQYKPSPGYVISEPIGVIGSVTGVDQTYYSHYNWATGFWYIDVVIPAGNAQNYDINVQFDGGPHPGYFHITASSTGNGTVTPADEYVKAGSTVYLNVVPNGTDTLTSFTDNGISKTVTDKMYTITNVQEDHAIVATFSGTSLVTLTVPITGNGTVTVSPSGTILGLNKYAFTAGTVISMTATPNNGATFVQWNSDASGSANPLSVTLSTSKTVGAEFNGGGTLCTVTLTIATTADVLPGVAPYGAFGTGSVSEALFPMTDVPMNSLVNIQLTAGNSNCYLYALVVNGIPVLPVYGRNGENISLSAMSTTPIQVNNTNTTVVAYFQRIGDLNLDGQVGILDLNIICTFTFDAEKPYIQAAPLVNRHSSQDINRDGVVNLVDASLLLTQYGKVT